MFEPTKLESALVKMRHEGRVETGRYSWGSESPRKAAKKCWVWTSATEVAELWLQVLSALSPGAGYPDRLRGWTERLCILRLARYSLDT